MGDPDHLPPHRPNPSPSLPNAPERLLRGQTVTDPWLLLGIVPTAVTGFYIF